MAVMAPASTTMPRFHCQNTVPAMARTNGTPTYRLSDEPKCRLSDVSPGVVNRCKLVGTMPPIRSPCTSLAVAAGVPFVACGPKRASATGSASRIAPTRTAHVNKVLTYGHRLAKEHRSARRKSATAMPPNNTVLARISADTKNCAVQSTARSTPTRAGFHCCRAIPSWRTRKMIGGNGTKVRNTYPPAWKVWYTQKP